MYMYMYMYLPGSVYSNTCTSPLILNPNLWVVQSIGLGLCVCARKSECPGISRARPPRVTLYEWVAVGV